MTAQTHSIPVVPNAQGVVAHVIGRNDKDVYPLGAVVRCRDYTMSGIERDGVVHKRREPTAHEAHCGVRKVVLIKLG